VSQLRKCLTDQDIVLPEIPKDLGKNLTLETRPVRIIDRMEKAMRRKTVPMLKIIWEFNGKDIITWETEARMNAEYPEWYGQYEGGEPSSLNSGTSSFQVGETCHVPSSR